MAERVGSWSGMDSGSEPQGHWRLPKKVLHQSTSTVTLPVHYMYRFFSSCSEARSELKTKLGLARTNRMEFDESILVVIDLLNQAIAFCSFTLDWTISIASIPEVEQSSSCTRFT